MINSSNFKSPEDIWDYFKEKIHQESDTTILGWFRNNPMNTKKRISELEDSDKFLVTSGKVTQFNDLGDRVYSIRFADEPGSDTGINYIEVRFEEDDIDVSGINIGDYIAVSLCGDYDYSSNLNTLDCFCYDLIKVRDAFDCNVDEEGCLYTDEMVENCIQEWEKQNPQYKRPSSYSSSSSSSSTTGNSKSGGCYIATAVYAH